MSYYLKYTGIVLLLLSLALPASAQTEKIEIVPKAFLILPEESTVKIKWIIIPSKEEETSGSNQTGQIQFCLNSKDKPIVAYNGKVLLNPVTGSIIKISKSFKKMVCTEDGAILFSDGDNLYYAEVGKSDKGIIPEASLKPVLELPLKYADVYAGDRSLYATGYNEGSKIYEIFLFNLKNKSFEKIATFNEKVNALTGNKERIFVASGRQVWEFSDGRFKFFFEHPREEILGLLYSEKTGLFYRTFHGIGYIKNGHAIEFLQIEDPEVFLKGTSLYIFFSRVFGLIELTNIDDLKRYNFRIEKIMDVRKNF
jgi:hypothetical protein